MAGGMTADTLRESALRELAIEVLCVDPVQLPHALGEIAVRGFDQEMIVVVHQTTGMHRPVEAGDDLRQHAPKQTPALLAQENGLPPIAPAGHRIQATGKLDA